MVTEILTLLFPGTIAVLGPWRVLIHLGLALKLPQKVFPVELMAIKVSWHTDAEGRNEEFQVWNTFRIQDGQGFSHFKEKSGSSTIFFEERVIEKMSRPVAKLVPRLVPGKTIQSKFTCLFGIWRLGVLPESFAPNMAMFLIGGILQACFYYAYAFEGGATPEAMQFLNGAVALALLTGSGLFFLHSSLPSESGFSSEDMVMMREGSIPLYLDTRFSELEGIKRFTN